MSSHHNNLEQKVRDIIEKRGENWKEWKENNNLKKKRKDFPTKMTYSKEIEEDLLLDAYLHSINGETPWYFICKDSKHYNGLRATKTHQCRFCEGIMQLFCCK